MRLIADAEGRRRIWYTSAEIERTCEETLVAADLWPQGDAAAVDVEGLLEHGLLAQVDYSVELPEGTLGYTIFARPIRVIINADLTAAASRPGVSLGVWGRWRATIAHEAAHVIFHSPLYLPADEAVGSPPGKPIRCPRVSIDEPRGVSDWREVQANMGMAALLMPKPIFDREAYEAFDRRGRFVPPIPSAAPAVDQVATILAERFQVSRRAAGIRLITTGYVEE